MQVVNATSKVTFCVFVQNWQKNLVVCGAQGWAQGSVGTGLDTARRGHRQGHRDELGQVWAQGSPGFQVEVGTVLVTGIGGHRVGHRK